MVILIKIIEEESFGRCFTCSNNRSADSDLIDVKLSILDQLATPIVATGRDFNCLYFNQAWADFFLTDFSELQSMKSLDFFPLELKRSTGLCYRSTIDHGTVTRREISLDGTSFYSVISPLKSEDGTVTAAVEVLFEKYSDDCPAFSNPLSDDENNSCGHWVPVFISTGNNTDR